MNPGHYGEAFNEHLVGVLSGDFEHERRQLFAEWLESFPFLCEQCEAQEFRVSASDVGEDDLIVCEKCGKARH
jgi:hypothetical protein